MFKSLPPAFTYSTNLFIKLGQLFLRKFSLFSPVQLLIQILYLASDEVSKRLRACSPDMISGWGFKFGDSLADSSPAGIVERRLLCRAHPCAEPHACR